MFSSIDMLSITKTMCEEYIRTLLLERDINSEAERVYSTFQFGGTMHSKLTGNDITIDKVPNGIITNEKFASLFMSYDDSVNVSNCTDLECTRIPFTNKKLTVTEEDTHYFKRLMTSGHSIQGVYCMYTTITSNVNGDNRCMCLKDIRYNIVDSNNVDTGCYVTMPTNVGVKWSANRVCTPELLLVNVLITDSKTFPNGNRIVIDSLYYADILNTLLNTNSLTEYQYIILYNSLIKNCLGLSIDDSKQLITRLIKEFSVSLDTNAKISDYNAELYQYANTEVACNSVDMRIQCIQCASSKTLYTRSDETVNVIPIKSVNVEANPDMDIHPVKKTKKSRAKKVI
jgi:hypothetical protein